MLNSVRRLLAPLEEQPAGYQPIAAEERDAETATSLPAPERGHRNVYLSFWVLGAAVLLPWNAFMCTFPLWMSLFPNGPIQDNLPSILSITFTFANLIFLGVAQRNVKQVSPTERLRWSLLLLLGSTVLLAFPLIPVVLPRLGAAGSVLLLPLLLAIALLLALTSSFLQSAVIALAALWGSKEIVAVMSGQGGIAVLVSLVQVILAVVQTTANQEPGKEVLSSNMVAEGLYIIGAVTAVIGLACLRYLVSHPDYARVAVARERRVTLATDKDMVKRVFFKNYAVEFAVAFVFVVTLAIFPAITVTIHSTAIPTPKLLNAVVFIAFHFFVFNVGDFCGRTYLPALRPFQSFNSSRLVVASIARMAFVPLFLYCNTRARYDVGKFKFPDIVYFLILLAFGLSNGAISTLCMMHASTPELNPNITEDEKDVAGTLAAFCLVFGLAVGSVCSIGVTSIINHGV